MGSFSQNVWNQLKNKSANDLIKALLKGGFRLVDKVKVERIYRHPDGRKVSIHYHKGNKTYGAGLLKELIEDTGWSEEDMRRLKLIK
jgi:predicted RNA binding protein YcfA (HicA-like mRNA interferase family)